MKGISFDLPLVFLLESPWLKNGLTLSISHQFLYILLNVASLKISLTSKYFNPQKWSLPYKLQILNGRNMLGRVGGGWKSRVLAVGREAGAEAR